MAFPSPLAQPPHAAPAPVPAAAPHLAVQPPAPSRRGRSAPLWLFAIVVVAALGLAAYLLTFLGVAASVVAMVLALLPLTGVLFAVHLVDRWEPEPRSLKIAAVAWGAVIAVGLALLVDLLVAPVLGVIDPARADALSAVIQAPIVEEVAKGLGVFAIFLFGRRAFDGPVDGVVYGALVGAGFAFTENILYFATSLLEGGVGATTTTFALRGILSPFAHVMFTSVTGYALGLAARAGARPGAALGPWIAGMVGGIVLHGLWNGSAVFADFFALYVTLQVPLFIGFVIGVLLLRREESRLTWERLDDYVVAGWFSPAERDMLATARGRRAAVAWARTLPGDRSARMKAFIRESTSLAAARQRAITGRDARAIDDERIFLARAVSARAALLGP
ncbi:PrsW family intramembrane metalloprotease [Microbacterium sp.]|uniref:PrsW family intramembrane metalloprotease n=1 Tax=Microbacterium sp. TaxID=51671 RepID=UPI0039E4A64C